MNFWVGLAFKELMRNRRFSLFFVLNLSIGLVGFIALNAFNHSIKAHLQDNLKEILTADLAVYSSRPLDKIEENIIDRVLGPQRHTARQITFFSMISGKNISRLARIVAIDDAFPLYGRITFDNSPDFLHKSPDNKNNSLFRNPPPLNNSNPHPGAWISRDLALVLNIKKGDLIGIGSRQFKADAIVTATPAGAVSPVELAPVIHIGTSRLKETGLMGFGSRTRHISYYKLPPGTDIVQITQTLRNEFSALVNGEPQIDVYNSKDVNQNLGRIFGYFTGYLGLVAIVALFLAGIGTAYLFRGYLNDRLKEMAILMGLGAGRMQTYGLVLCQVIMLGLGATLLSVLLSVVVLPLFPEVMKGLIPPGFKTVIPPGTLGLAVFMGTLGSLIFCLPVFVRIHDLKPVVLLQGLHTFFSIPAAAPPRSIWKWMPRFHGKQKIQLISFIPGGLVFWGLAMAQTRSLERGTLFLAGFFSVFGIMALIGRGLLILVKFFSRTHRVIAKIALRNIFRHKHASVSCFVTIAMGAFLINVIPQVKNGIQDEISRPQGLAVPGFFLFDIQPEQLSLLKTFLDNRKFKLTNASPLVQGRINSVNGVGFYERIEEKKTGLLDKFKRKEKKDARSQGEFRRRTFTFSWRKALDASESMVKGKALSNTPWNFESDQPFEVSLEEGFAQRFHLKIGDVMEFDVQGIPLKGRVKNLRKVRWNSFQPNFFILFQKGVLNDAPRTFLASIPQMPESEKMPLQNAIIQKFPNISVLDVKHTVAQLLDITQRLTISINFMAWLAILAGLVVLFSIVRHETQTRVWEINLLKVLGAGFSDVRRIILFEFGLLGTTAALFGIVLSLGVSYGISWFFFGRLWVFHFGYSLFSLGAISLISMATALVATGRVIHQKPVALLKSL
ncbi:putative ABC transport system permease protein [Desulfocicer vacuolatum DSM 3385]|uniref:Putative ABC transport system permease protein n=1 Tax=Desulfocicer vacuolatum DSM 3385 TaxID=1121400 RepID=A0A1W2ED13_9BACT|nr:FtsX-like permease family protein [Desulfocicer vacuolatum]SMD07585.1 putative ABC transport system permease protein [Desulfocicer vacuolatum DSM 3385]